MNTMKVYLDDLRFNGVNMDLKLYIRKSGVPQWQVAQEMEMSESNLTRLLRREDERTRKEIRDAVNRIVKRRKLERGQG